MKINYDFYNPNDTYNDGDEQENLILEYIKKYNNDYEKAFRENNDWTTYYHLSDLRKNSVIWYPFKKDCSILEIGAGMGAITDVLCEKAKKVTSIELSKRRALAIAERNKNQKNLEIIVGNFDDIKLKEKYDYILLNGVYEYACQYIKTDNPYVDFIYKIKKYLKPNGKILIAIENRFGLKYWCGAGEDHTGIPYDGINNYNNSNFAKTFSKIQLEQIAQNCKMNANFYYLFPDYKFPKIIYTDEALEKNIYLNYTPYYYRKMDMFANEGKIYNDIYDNNMIPFFANSYFVELSIEKCEKEIKFVKFNNEYRKKEYNIYTYLKNGKYYKVPGSIEAKNKINEIVKINEMLINKKINVGIVKKEGSSIYTEEVKGINLYDIIKNEYKKKNIDKIKEIYDSIYELIKKSSNEAIEFENDNIFTKYDIEFSEENINKLHFRTNLLIDVIPKNIIFQNGIYTLIDQEWMENNAPIEYVMYRAIITTFGEFGDSSIIKLLNEKYKIDVNLMTKLDNKFLKELHCESFDTNMIYYSNYNIIDNIYDVINKANEFSNLNNTIQKLNEEKEILNNNIEKSNIEMISLNNDIKVLDEKNAALNNDIKVLDEKNAALNNDIKVLDEKNAALNNDIRVLDEKNAILNNNIKELGKENNELRNQIVFKDNQNYQLNNRINQIENSKGWKVLEKIRKYKNKFIVKKKKNIKTAFDNKKTILFIVQSWLNMNNLEDTHIGGTTIHVLDLIKVLGNKLNTYVLTAIDNRYVLITFKNNKQIIYDLGVEVSVYRYDRYDYRFYEMINRLIDELQIDMVHIHHIMNFPCDLQYIANKTKVIISLHDYTSICPNHFLIDQNAKYCQEIKLKKCVECAKGVDFDTRVTAIGNLLKSAEKIIVPDSSVSDEIKKYYNINSFVTIPNGIDIKSFEKFDYSDKKLGKVKNVALIGGLNIHKGSKIAEQIVKNNDNNIKYHLFGMSGQKYLMEDHDNFIYHGTYQKKDLPKLLNDNHIDLVLMLSICPESFSYVLSEVIFSKIPVIAIDIGAIGKRVKEMKVGMTVKYGSDYRKIIECYDTVFEENNYKEYIKILNNTRVFETKDMLNSILAIYDTIDYKYKNKNYKEIDKNINKYNKITTIIRK